MGRFISLNILDMFKFIYKKLGVDYDDMRLILKMKLTMNSRMESNLLNNQYFDNILDKDKFTRLLYLVLGFIMMFMLIFIKDVFSAMVIYFSAFMFFMLTMFVSDYSYLILDTKDNGILATRGVSAKTLSASKVTHIMIYIVNISLLLTGFSLIASIKYGLIFSLVFLIEIFVIDIFMIIISGLIYFIMLKAFDGEKLRNVITITQILMVVLFSMGYFVVGNMIEFNGIFKDSDLALISYFLPPFWFAAPLKIIATKNISKTLIVLSSLAFIVPIISIFMYFKFSPAFEKSILKLNNTTLNKKPKKHNLTMMLSRILCRDKLERVFFNFVSNIIRNDMEFKFSVYPIIACNSVIYLMLYREDSEFFSRHLYLYLYLCAIPIPIIIGALKQSNNYNASYIYKTIPIKNEMLIYKGAIKACLVNIILPNYVIQSIVIACIYDGNLAGHLVVIFIVNILITLASFVMIKKCIPFSKPINRLNKNGVILDYFLVTILILVLIGIHLLMSIIGEVAIYAYTLIIFLITICLYKTTLCKKVKL